MTYEPSDLSINRLVCELDQGLTDNEPVLNISPSVDALGMPIHNLRDTKYATACIALGLQVLIIKRRNQDQDLLEAMAWHCRS